MDQHNAKVDDFIAHSTAWKEEFKALRSIVQDCGLVEEWKLKQPCYTFDTKNIVIIGGLKDSCILCFFKGSLLKDEQKILEFPGPNTRVDKLFCFTNAKEIFKQKSIIKAYVLEAIEMEKSGLKAVVRKKLELVFSEELELKIKQSAKFKKAFEALTPGKKRGYNLYFATPKSSKSRIDRIEKYAPKILDGKGIHDCVCGHSNRMPRCDGSHKYI